jgi:hypothetical protein
MPESESAQPPTCLQCHDQGWWYDEVTGFHYCGCQTGIRAQDEDGEGGD